MGVKGSKNAIQSNAAEETVVDDGVKVVSLDVFQRQYHAYESELRAFCAGFFLNKDLDCAKIRNCSHEIYWLLHGICESVRNGTKYRIAKTHGYPCSYVIVKPQKDASLERFGIKRDEITVEVSYSTVVSHTSSFRRLIGEFMEDPDLVTFVMKNVSTGDFPAVCEILKPFSTFDFVAETKLLKEGSQQFDYVLTKKMVMEVQAMKNPDNSQYVDT